MGTDPQARRPGQGVGVDRWWLSPRPAAAGQAGHHGEGAEGEEPARQGHGRWHGGSGAVAALRSRGGAGHGLCCAALQPQALAIGIGHLQAGPLAARIQAEQQILERRAARQPQRRRPPGEAVPFAGVGARGGAAGQLPRRRPSSDLRLDGGNRPG
ncbi:MAG: hypothetical protein ACK5PF_00970 [bacterium]